MTGLPAWKVEIDADPSVVGIFVLDTSVLDGAGVLASDVRYVAIPANDVRSVATHRGRARDDSANDVGTATIELDAWSGNYDPDNPSTTYQYNGELLLKQGILVRISVTIAAVDHVVYTGTLDTTAAGYGWEPTMVWTCVDLMAGLGGASFPPSTSFIRLGEVSEDRVAWLLQYDPATLAAAVVTTGGLPLIATQGGGTVLSNLEDVARSEWGRVYADRTNVLHVTFLADEYGRSTDLTISDSAAGSLSPDDLTVEPGLTLVTNKAILTRPEYGPIDSATDSVESTFTGADDLSIERFGERTVEAQVFLSVDADAQTLADYLATRRSTATTHLTSVSTSLGGETTAHQAAAADLDLGAWVLVERRTADGRNLSWLVSAEGIDHTSTPDSWTVNLATSPLAP